MFMVAGCIGHKIKAEHQSGFAQRVIVRERHETPPADLYQVGERPRVAFVTATILFKGASLEGEPDRVV